MIKGYKRLRRFSGSLMSVDRLCKAIGLTLAIVGLSVAHSFAVEESVIEEAVAKKAVVEEAVVEETILEKAVVEKKL